MKILVVLSAIICGCAALSQPEEVLAWSEVPFAWPSEAAKNDAIKSQDYIPANNLPLGMARWKDKLFITFPRWKAGVAATLTYVDLSTANKTATVHPYPDWKSNTLPKGDEKSDDNLIVSTFRIRVDPCDRLWVMETGLADILGHPKQISPTSLMIFDLNTDKLIRRYSLKQEDIKGHDSFFANVIVDAAPNECDKAFAYLPDLGGYGLVVYSFADNASWRVKHNYFHFDPLAGDLRVGGINFQWTDGIFGLALGTRDENGYRTAYFHALASTNEFSVNTQVLRNKTLATDPLSYSLFKLEGNKGPNSQSSTSVFDEKLNVLFLTQLNKDAVACWNPRTRLDAGNVALVAQDHEKMIFTNDITLDSDRNLWILSDKMPTFIYNTLDPNEINYRILKTPVDEVVKGTPCEA